MEQPLHEQIAADLRHRIVSGELPLGTAVPSEARLGETWQGSRAPVRQALATLRAEGLIGGGRGKPPVVLRQSLSQPFDTFLSFSRWASELGHKPGQRTIELALRPASAEIADALCLTPGAQVVQLLRLRFFDERPTMIERATFVEEVGRMLLDHDCDSGSIYAYLIGSGLRVGVARHVIDAVSADPTDVRLLDIPSAAPLLRERRLVRDVEGVPFEYSEDRYRPDIVSFTIENQLSVPPVLQRTYH